MKTHHFLIALLIVISVSAPRPFIVATSLQQNVLLLPVPRNIGAVASEDRYQIFPFPTDATVTKITIVASELTTSQNEKYTVDIINVSDGQSILANPVQLTQARVVYFGDILLPQITEDELIAVSLKMSGDYPNISGLTVSVHYTP